MKTIFTLLAGIVLLTVWIVVTKVSKWLFLASGHSASANQFSR